MRPCVVFETKTSQTRAQKQSYFEHQIGPANFLVIQYKQHCKLDVWVVRNIECSRRYFRDPIQTMIENGRCCGVPSDAFERDSATRRHIRIALYFLSSPGKRFFVKCFLLNFSGDTRDSGMLEEWKKRLYNSLISTCTQTWESAHSFHCYFLQPCREMSSSLQNVMKTSCSTSNHIYMLKR